MHKTYSIENQPNTWDYMAWLQRFRHACALKDGFHELRRAVFQNTVEIIASGFYFSAGDKVELNAKGEYATLEQGTIFYPQTAQLIKQATVKHSTVFFCINADCLETGHLLTRLGYRPAILNMASRQNPGGGVLDGMGAQEENLFRRSILLRSLYQYAAYAAEYGIAQHPTHQYPMPKESAGIYSPKVTVFRSSEGTGYSLLRQPYALDIVSVAAVNRPAISEVNGQARIAEEFLEPVRVKIRAVLRIAQKHENDSLILSALGCGAYRTPPSHMAELFAEVLHEAEFAKAFRAVIFAIVDDHNAWKEHNPEGNLIPFQKIFV